MNDPRQRTRVAALILAVTAATLPGRAQPAGVHPISGREYARPMGVAGAPWLDRDERENEEAPSRALQIIGVVEGSTVADVGAGSGYFTERWRDWWDRRGASSRPTFNKACSTLRRRRLQRQGLQNVTLILERAGRILV